MNEKKFDEAFQVLTDGLNENDKKEIISELSDNFNLKLEEYLKKLEEEKAKQIESGEYDILLIYKLEFFLNLNFI